MVRFFTTLFSLTENGNGKLKTHFCCSLVYNPLQRYTRSLEIKGRNRETSGQTRRVGNPTQGCTPAGTVHKCVTLELGV